MKKKMIALVAFAALVVLGLGMVETAVTAAQIGSCNCFDEPAAIGICENLCSFYAGSTCLEVGPAGISGCNYDGDCNYVFWSYCVSGHSYRRQIQYESCPDCWYI